MKLTDATVARLTLADDENEHIEWDDDLKGFGVRLRRSKARITRRWVCQYRPTPRRTRRMTLKGPPAVVRCAAARDWAKKQLAKVHLDDDPQAARIAARRAVTFGERADQFLDQIVATLRPATRDAYRRHLLVHAHPLRPRATEAITRSEISALLSSIARDRGLVAANRTRATLSALFAWCVTDHELAANPVIGTRVHNETSRDRVLRDAELKTIWDATGAGHDYHRIIRLLMLTACRRDEIGGMHWSEITGAVFTLPANRSKNKHAHEVPLDPLAVAQLPQRQGKRDVVFGRGDHGFSGWSRCKARLDTEVGLASWTLHDLRRSCATWMAENGIEPSHIDAVLNHVDNVATKGIRRVYNRANYTTPKKLALTKWAAHIAAITGQDMANLATLERSG
jgi:integrase